MNINYFSEQDTPGTMFNNDDMNKNRFEKTSGTTGAKSKNLRFQDSKDWRANKNDTDEKAKRNELDITK